MYEDNSFDSSEYEKTSQNSINTALEAGDIANRALGNSTHPNEINTAGAASKAGNSTANAVSESAKSAAAGTTTGTATGTSTGAAAGSVAGPGGTIAGAAAGIVLSSTADALKDPEDSIKKGFSIIIILSSLFLFLPVFIGASLNHWLTPSLSAVPTEIDLSGSLSNSAQKGTYNTKQKVSNLFAFFTEGESYIPITEMEKVKNPYYDWESRKSPYEDRYKEAAEMVQKSISYYKKDARLRLENYLAASENEYLEDDMTMETFYDCKNPFGTNFIEVNYSEILSIMTLLPENNFENLNIEKLREKLLSSDSIKHYYRMTVEVQWQKKEYKEDGSYKWVDISYEGEKDNEDFRAYGLVNISPYRLCQIFELFDLDPYEESAINEGLQNLDVLGYQLGLVRVYRGQANLGSDEKTELLNDIEKQELINYCYGTEVGLLESISNINHDILEKIYPPDGGPIFEVGEGSLKLDCPYYNQGDYTNYRLYKYGQGNVKSSGCCLVSALMIGQYITGIDISKPVNDYPNWIAYICNSPSYLTDGYITSNANNSKFVLREFDIKYTGQHDMNVESLIKELDEHKVPVMIHYKIGKFTKSGHFSVCTGYDSQKKVFYTNDPGKRTRTEVSFADMMSECTYYRTYSKN